MKGTRKSNDSDLAEYLRVGVIVNNTTHLKKWDRSQPMQHIITDLVAEHSIPKDPLKLALWRTDRYENGTKHINDENKWQVAKGSIIILGPSPEEVACSSFAELLTTGGQSMNKLVEVSKDEAVLMKIDHSTICHAICEIIRTSNDEQILTKGLRFLRHLHTRRLIKKIPSFIKAKLLDIISYNHEEAKSKDLIKETMQMLMSIRRYNRLSCDENLISHLQEFLKSNEPSLQESGLEFLNYLIHFPNNEEEEDFVMKKVINDKVIGLICDYILTSRMTRKMQQLLYRYQTYVLRPYWSKKMEKVDPTDSRFHALDRANEKAQSGEHTRRKGVSGSEEFLNSEGTPKYGGPTFVDNWKTILQRPRLTKSTSFKWRSNHSPDRRSRKDKVTSTRVRAHHSSTTLDFIRRALSPSNKSTRKSSILHSCIHTPKDEEEQFQFQFDGPVQYSVRRRPSESTLVRSVSASSILTVVSEFKNEEKQAPIRNITISSLTLNNLLFLAKNNRHLYYKCYLTKKSWYALAEQITQMICKVLEVGRTRPVDEPCESYHPIVFFNYPFFFESIFVEAIELIEKTQKEMKARFDTDTPKVINVMQLQLKNALSTKPTNIEDFRSLLKSFPYEVIASKQRAEIESNLKQELRHKPIFAEYRENVKPDIQKLVELNRLALMKTGNHFRKVNNKGDLIKDALLFLELSKNGEMFVYGECSSRACNHNAFINVSDIAEISIGKQSKLYSEIIYYHSEHDAFFRGKQQKQQSSEQEHWKLLFSIKTKNDTYYHFCAKDEEELHNWEDAINLVLRKPMVSPTYEEEIDDLLDLEVRIHFLHVEGIPVPDTAPVVPPPPSNYNFMVKSKTRAK